jgi:hypothetical protein
MKLTCKPVLLLYIIVCGCSCNDPKEPETPVNAVDEEIIFSVGNIQLTAYELKKNFELFKRNTTAANKRPVTEPEFKKWADEYTMRSYFLADAEAKGFYQRQGLLHAVETMESFILLQSNGPLEQQLLKDAKPGTPAAPASKSDILKRYYEGIGKRSAVIIDQRVLQAIEKYLQRSGPVPGLPKREFQALFQHDIVQFRTVEGKECHVALEQFIDAYNSLPIQQYLVNGGSVVAYLNKIAYASYIQKDAARLGITNDPKFKLDKKNYMNSLVYRKYEEEFLKDTALISPLEIQQTYDRIKSRFVQPEEVVFSMFSFKELRDALRSKIELQKTGSDTTTLQQVVAEQKHLTLNVKSTLLPDSLKRNLVAMELLQVSQPFFVSGRYTLLVKEQESGRRQQELNEVRDLVVQEVRQQRLEINKREKFVQLSQRFEKKGAVDYRKFN